MSSQSPSRTCILCHFEFIILCSYYIHTVIVAVWYLWYTAASRRSTMIFWAQKLILHMIFCLLLLNHMYFKNQIVWILQINRSIGAYIEKKVSVATSWSTMVRLWLVLISIFKDSINTTVAWTKVQCSHNSDQCYWLVVWILPSANVKKESNSSEKSYFQHIYAFKIKCNNIGALCWLQLFSHCHMLLLPVKMYLISLKITWVHIQTTSVPLQDCWHVNAKLLKLRKYEDKITFCRSSIKIKSFK